jgi:hypothetical protein
LRIIIRYFFIRSSWLIRKDFPILSEKVDGKNFWDDQKHFKDHIFEKQKEVPLWNDKDYWQRYIPRYNAIDYWIGIHNS